MRPDLRACLSCRKTFTQCTQSSKQSGTWHLHLPSRYDISTISGHHLTEDRTARTRGCLLLASAVCTPCLAHPFLTVLCLLNWGFTTWPQQNLHGRDFSLFCSFPGLDVLNWMVCAWMPFQDFSKTAQAWDSPSITPRLLPQFFKRPLSLGI